MSYHFWFALYVLLCLACLAVVVGLLSAPDPAPPLPAFR